MIRRIRTVALAMTRAVALLHVAYSAIARAKREPHSVAALHCRFVDDTGHTRTLYVWVSTDPGGPVATVAKLRCEVEAAKDMLDEAHRANQTQPENAAHPWI